MKRFLSSLVLTVLVSSGACKNDDDVAVSPAPACTLPAGASDDFCAAVATYDGRCGHCDDCTGKNLQKCTQRGAAISAQYRAAYIACKDSAPCVANYAFVGCIADKMKTATPTQAQMDAKTKFCTACGSTNQAGCDGFFDVNGAGYDILLAGDATATKAATNCASHCDTFEYGVCVALTQCADDGGDFCVDGGFCAPQ